MPSPVHQAAAPGNWAGGGYQGMHHILRVKGQAASGGLALGGLPGVGDSHPGIQGILRAGQEGILRLQRPDR